jgi:membrane-associated phospholipid phosphatase
VDWRVYHAINVWVSHHHWVGQVFRYIESWGTVLIAVAAALLWLLARPGASPKWKLAASSALTAGALGYVVNQVVHALWDRARPYEVHAGVYHPYASSTDASFPSDHSSAAFGIAFAVLLYDRLVGALFVIGAALIAAGRVIVGAHYPLDVLAGVVVGLAAAVVGVKLARPVLAFLVRIVERLTDPVVRPAWRYFSTGSSR